MSEQEVGEGVAARHSMGSVEYGTPDDAVVAACNVMGGINLDPASSAALNARVRAHSIYTHEDDGFTKPWNAWSVLLNPPGGRSDDQQRPTRPNCTRTGSCGLPPGHVHKGVESNQKKWWSKLVEEYVARRTTTAVYVAFSVEMLQITQSTPKSRILPLEFPVCYPSQRQRFWRDGARRDSPPHSSCYVYLPPLAGADGDWTHTRAAIARFRLQFGKLGHVVVPT